VVINYLGGQLMNPLAIKQLQQLLFNNGSILRA